MLILNFCQQSIQFQNTVPFKKLCRNFADLLNSLLFLNIHKTQVAHDSGVFSKNIESLPFRSSQKRTFECFNLCFTFFQHLAVTGQQGHCFDLFSRWLSAFFRHKLLNGFIYLMTTTGAAFEDFFINSFDFKSGDFTLIGTLYVQLISQPDTFSCQSILVGLPRITDRLIHLRGIQCFESSVRILRYIDDHVMGMKLRIKETAVVVMVLGIDEFAGKRKVFGGVIIPFANTNCRKLFQFSHADFDRTPMGFCQPWIKHRHH